MRPVIVALLVGAACGGGSQSAKPAAPAAAAPAPTAGPTSAHVEQVTLRDVGLDPDAMDPSADPCDDFYRFACGGFVDKAEIPSDQPRWGTFDIIAEKNRDVERRILEDAAKQPGDDPVLRKIGAYYGSCMDEAAIEKDGLRGIEPLLAAVRKVKDARSLAAAVATLHRAGVPVLFGSRDVQDRKDATQVIFGVFQGGLGMPDRDYYLADDEKAVALRAEYLAHVERTLGLLGRAPAQAKKEAADLVALETELARGQRPRTEMRDAELTYNRLDRAGVEKALPSLGWKGYFATLGAPDVQPIQVATPKYLETIEQAFHAVKPAVWRSYLEVHVVGAFAEALPKRFQEEAFAWQRTLSGQKEQRARWKRCVAETDGALGELLGQPFVKAAFAGESKVAADAMVKQIARAFAENLERVPWMDEATKAKARTKLAKVDFLIGYPDKWREYDFAIGKSFAANSLAASEFERHRRMAKIGKPVDRKEWGMTPPTVNAYYSSSLNEMVFPAGILQPPFYSVKASAPVNLGGMGLVVGHELTHGYDDQGAKFDGDGNMSGWWPDPVTKAFKERTECVVRYYDNYEAAPGLHENGTLTQGENIADLGGAKLAFHAYRSLRKDAPVRQLAGGFTEDQQFFIALGQAWCMKATPEFERLQVKTNPHSLNRFRVNGPLSSLREFGEAWGCREGARMRPKDRCEVW